MNLKHLFFPEKIKIPDSQYNHNISVLKYLGQPTIFVDGLVESGDVMTNIWRAGIKRLLPKKFIPESVLLLGLAGGSNAKLISKYYPNATITGVEIDQAMIDIGKKYFGLDKIKNLKIVVEDALVFTKNLGSKDHFDLVLVDCFIGKTIPAKLENLDFLRILKNHSRFTLINRVAWFDFRKDTNAFLRNLATRFFFVVIHTSSNVVISIV